jgi:HD superfamily phosphodiesterase
MPAVLRAPVPAGSRLNGTSSGWRNWNRSPSVFPGVEQAFAIQAGRELRVLVSAKETDDTKAAKICRDIAKAFEEQLTYPGEIKVTVVRESRFTELAR